MVGPGRSGRCACSSAHQVSPQPQSLPFRYTATAPLSAPIPRRVCAQGVTVSALLAKAVGLALAKHPIVNSNYVDGGIKYNPNINVAMAVALPDGGLITPVLKNADSTDIYSLGRSWKVGGRRARGRRAWVRCRQANGTVTPRTPCHSHHAPSLAGRTSSRARWKGS